MIPSSVGTPPLDCESTREPPLLRCLELNLGIIIKSKRGDTLSLRTNHEVIQATNMVREVPGTNTPCDNSSSKRIA